MPTYLLVFVCGVVVGELLAWWASESAHRFTDRCEREAAELKRQWDEERARS